MGRKPDYMAGFRPINPRALWRRGGFPRMRTGSARFLSEASRPGRLVAATACPGRHETPRTVRPQSSRPRIPPPQSVRPEPLPRRRQAQHPVTELLGRNDVLRATRADFPATLAGCISFRLPPGSLRRRSAPLAGVRVGWTRCCVRGARGDWRRRGRWWRAGRRESTGPGPRHRMTVSPERSWPG